MSAPATRTRRWWLLSLTLLLLFGVPAIDLGYVFWPYPQARGVEALHARLLHERALVYALADAATGRRILRVEHAIYNSVFSVSGLQVLLQGATTPQRGANRLGARWVHAHWGMLRTLAYGLQLRALRIGVLWVSAPLLLLLTLAALADGITRWCLRRFAVARESSFLYHRCKRLALAALLLPLLLYLLPPVTPDPRWLLTPCLALFPLALTQAVTHFKKYL